MSNTFKLQPPKSGRVVGSKNKPIAAPLNFLGLEPRLTTKEAASILRKSHITLEIWRVNGYGPKYIKIGRSVRYLLSDLQAFELPHNHTSGRTA